MKKILLGLIGSMLIMGTASAQLQIIPDIDEDSHAEVEKALEAAQSGGGGSAIDDYYVTAHELEKEGKCGVQITSGIMTWNTIMCYASYLVQFISQLGLAVGAIMIIAAGYQYATYVFVGGIGDANTKIKDAIVGVIIIIFSYAILRIVTTAFLS